jgi:hypothetical protein
MSRTLAVSNGDLDTGAAGSGILIEGADKANQDIAEALLSEYDFVRDQGGKLAYMVVPAIGGKTLIAGEVQKIIQRLKASQAEDPWITLDERILDADVSVYRDDSTGYFFFRLSCPTAGNSVITVTDSVRQRVTQLAHTWPNGVQPFM